MLAIRAFGLITQFTITRINPYLATFRAPQLILTFVSYMAVHYYDEENIEVGKVPVGSSVSSSHKVELTEEEKNAARQAAIKRLTEEQYRSLKKRPAKKKVDESVQQMSLF